MKKLLSFIILIFALASCSPTYAKVEPVEKDRFSNAEKTGAVLFTFFVVWACNQEK